MVIFFLYLFPLCFCFVFSFYLFFCPFSFCFYLFSTPSCCLCCLQGLLSIEPRSHEISAFVCLLEEARESSDSTKLYCTGRSNDNNWVLLYQLILWHLFGDELQNLIRLRHPIDWSLKNSQSLFSFKELLAALWICLQKFTASWQGCPRGPWGCRVARRALGSDWHSVWNNKLGSRRAGGLCTALHT